MAFQKFVVLIVVLVMLAGVTVYVALDSELFAPNTEVVTNQDESNTINNK